MSAQLERLVQQLLNRVRQLEDDRSQPQVESWALADGSEVSYAYPPPGGVPAATFVLETKKTTPGTALCTLAVEDTLGVFKPGTETLTVENQVGSVVGISGRMMTIALNSTSKRWQVIVEDCTAGSTGGGSNPDTNPDNPVPVPSPDPINEGTSKSFSLGYTLGV